MKSGIYKIINLVNNKCYIGSSSNTHNRIRNHFRNLKNNKHSNSHLQAAYNKYGKENFISKVVEICSKDVLFEREQFYINQHDFNILYNQTKIAGKGGSEVQRIPVYLLNLKGEILETFESLLEAREFLNRTRLELRNCNNGQVIKGPNRQYRCVTVEFYENNIDKIQSWKPYSNYTIYKTNFVNVYTVYREGIKIKSFKSQLACAKLIGVSRERVRQLATFGGQTKKGFSVVLTQIDNNIY